MTASDVKFGKEEANRLIDLGWRQGAIMSADLNFPELEVGNFYIICSQSCNIASESLQRDPFIEVAIAKRLGKIYQRSPEATGKNARRLHVGVTGVDFEGFEIDINYRFFIHREKFLEKAAEEAKVSDDDCQKFAAWLGRNYSRIAIPNSLVERMKNSIQPKLVEYLNGKVGDEQSPRHEFIKSAWVYFEPDDEVGDDVDYTLEMKFLCLEGSTADLFDEQLIEVFGESQITIDKIKFSFQFSSHDETRLSDLDGWKRFTEWDFLTGLVDSTLIPTRF